MVSGHPRHHLCMILTRGICYEALRAQLNATLPCNHIFHHCCVEDVLRHARYIASSGRDAVDCLVCYSPAIVSLLPTFGYVSDGKPCPCKVQAAHAEGGGGNEDDSVLSEQWHMFAHRQDVRCGSAVMQALQEDVAQLAYLSFIPHRGRGYWVRLLRLITATELLELFFNASSGTRSVFGRWAALVNDAIKKEDHASVVGDLPLFISLPAGNDHEYVIHDYNLSHLIAAPRSAVNLSCASLRWPRNMVEECTWSLFVLLAEHRGSVHGVHGIPRPCPRHSTDNRGHSRGNRGSSTGFHGHSAGFHGIPQQVAQHRGGPWH